jgi:hypothetical protein
MIAVSKTVLSSCRLGVRAANWAVDTEDLRILKTWRGSRNHLLLNKFSALVSQAS